MAPQCRQVDREQPTSEEGLRSHQQPPLRQLRDGEVRFSPPPLDSAATSSLMLAPTAAPRNSNTRSRSSTTGLPIDYRDSPEPSSPQPEDYLDYAEPTSKSRRSGGGAQAGGATGSPAPGAVQPGAAAPARRKPGPKPGFKRAGARAARGGSKKKKKEASSDEDDWSGIKVIE